MTATLLGSLLTGIATLLGGTALILSKGDLLGGLTTIAGGIAAIIGVLSGKAALDLYKAKIETSLNISEVAVESLRAENARLLDNAEMRAEVQRIKDSLNVSNRKQNLGILP